MEEKYFEALNAPTVIERLDALKSVVKLAEQGAVHFDKPEGYVNNHIHTTYSFSPYSPTLAVWKAKMAGLLTAGIVDHDSISGAEEFIQAGRILRMATTVGIECRVSMKATPFADRRLNNTDQVGIAYVAMHGIPHTKIDEIKAFIEPYREKRNIRNRKMLDRINALLPEPWLDFDRDVVSLSMSHEGGSITERHLVYALSLKLIEHYGKGRNLVLALENTYNLNVKGKALEFLLDGDNPHYAYDLLSVLKGNFVKQFYIDATDECPDVLEFISVANKVGAIAAYAYLGDVTGSVTGDKSDATYEDAYIEELFIYLKEIGFNSVTYMPSRNSDAQLEVVKYLCDRLELFQISGEDINSPRQSFTCEALLKPESKNLITATWAMIGHEQAATKDVGQSMFGSNMVKAFPILEDRIKHFYSLGKV